MTDSHPTTAALAHYGRALAILERDPELHRLALARLAVSMGNLHANREDVRAWRVNGLTPPLGLALMKPLRKVGQFFNRKD